MLSPPKVYEESSYLLSCLILIQESSVCTHEFSSECYCSTCSANFPTCDKLNIYIYTLQINGLQILRKISKTIHIGPFHVKSNMLERVNLVHIFVQVTGLILSFI